MRGGLEEPEGPWLLSPGREPALAPHMPKNERLCKAGALNTKKKVMKLYENVAFGRYFYFLAKVFLSFCLVVRNGDIAVKCGCISMVGEVMSARGYRYRYFLT